MPKREIPPELLNCPCNLINELKDHLNSTAKRYIDQFSLQSAFTLISHLISRRYVTEARMRPEIYSLLVGDSGVGKGYCAGAIVEIDGLNTVIVSGATSDSGLKTDMVLNGPALLSIVDEMGSKFDSKDTHLSGWVTAIREVYSTFKWLPKSFSGFKNGNIDEKQKKYLIKNPALTILGMSTLSQLQDGLTSENVKNGTINRFFLIDAQIHEVVRNRNGINAKISPELFGRLCEISKRSFEPDKYDHDPDLELIYFDDGVEDLFDDTHDELVASKNKEFNVRTMENALRLAMIITIANKNRTITREVAEWCIKYATYWAYNIKILSESVGANGYSKDIKRILDKLKNCESSGITLKKFHRFIGETIGWEPRKRSEFLNDMVADMVIEKANGPKNITSGKSEMHYFYIGRKRQ